MKKVYSSKYVVHKYNNELKTLYSDWLSETENMTTEDFQYEIEKWVEIFVKYTPSFLFDDCRKFIYPISPSDQLWMANLMNKKLIESGLKKYAHIVPVELIAEISVEQLFDEFFAMDLPNQYPIVNFTSKEEALDWLYAK